MPSRDRNLLWLALAALLITGALAALAIWCASRPLVSFPLQPKKTAAIGLPQLQLKLSTSTFLSAFSTPAAANGDCAFASLASDRPVVPGRRDLFASSERSMFNVQRSTFNASILSAGFTPAFVTNPSGGAMAPAAFSVRAIRTAPAVYSRRKVASGDLLPEGVISSESERESERASAPHSLIPSVPHSLGVRAAAHV